MNVFYVYRYEVDGTTVYVGKGYGNRDTTHLREAKRDPTAKKRSHFYNFLAKALRGGKTINVIRELEGLEEDEALRAEIFFITEVYGRREFEGGTLYNRLRGGDGVDSATAKALWDFDNRRELRSKLSKEMWADPVHHAKMVSILRTSTQSPESRLRYKASNKRRWENPEHVLKMTAIRQEYWRAKKADPESMKRFSEAVRAGIAKGKLRRQSKDTK